MSRNAIILGLGLVLLPSCSLSPAGNPSSVSLDFSKMRFNQTRLPVLPDPAYVGQFSELSQMFLDARGATDRSSSAPQTIGGFSCFGINVTARDIPSSNANFAANYSNDPDCTYPGVSSLLVPASGSGATVELDVPFGTNRLIQVVGLQSTTAQCPTGLLTDHVFDSTITGAYELGRAVGNLTTASNVTIKSRFTPDNLKKPFSCPVVQPYAYVVNAMAPQDANGGRLSLHGVIQGFKVERGTGALTPIPGATQTTHGVIDNWSAITASNAGKWLYVYVDNYDGTPTGGPYGADGTVDAYNASTMGAANGGCGGVSGRLFHNAEVDVYSIDKTTGNLTFVQVVQTGENKGFDCNYGAVSVDPYDQILFVGYGDNVSAYQIDQTTGALLPSPQILSSSAPSNSGFAIAPGGNAIYTPNITNLSGFSISNSVSSPLAALTPAIFNIDQNGSAPYRLSMDPEGRFMYSANQDAGGAGISQFSINTDGTLNLIPGPADPGIAYPRVLVDPYYGTTLYGADETRDGVNAFPILSDGHLGAMFDSTVVPDKTLINTINDIQIDPWSNFLIAAYDTGYLVTFGLNRDGSFSGNNRQIAITGASNPAVIAIAMVPQ